MRIIPAIDVIESHAVRLTKGDYGTKKVYNEDPVEVAKEFEDNGIEYLHLVDLDGAKKGRIINWKVLERIATQTSLKIDFGGGLRSDKDLKIAFDSGAKQVTGGSIAVKDRETFEGWLETFGPEKIILGADAKDRKIAVSGWEEESKLDLIDFVGGYIESGIRYVVCTDISKDGMLEGPAIDLYNEMLKEIPDMKLIASGGVSGMKDVDELAETNVDGVIIGKAIYEGRIDLKELRKYVE